MINYYSIIILLQLHSREAQHYNRCMCFLAVNNIKTGDNKMYILCKKCMKKVYIDPKENIDSIKRIKVTHNEQEFTAYGIECEHCGHMHYEYIDDDNAKQLFDEIMQLTKSIMVLNSSIVNDGNRKKKLIRTYTNRLQALKKKLTTLRGMLQQQYSGKEFYIVGKFSHKQAINFEKQKYYSE